MRILLVYVILTINSGSCSDKEAKSMNCNKQNAKELTDQLIEKKGTLDLSELKAELQEDSLYYVIEYLPKDTMMLGGGGKFKVSKEDCSIIEKKFYQ